MQLHQLARCGVGVLFLLAAPSLLAQDPPAVPQAVAALEYLKPKQDGGPISWMAGEYRYDGVGNITAIGNESFIYDKLGRLKSAAIRGPDLASVQAETFDNDAYGNLTDTEKLGQTISLSVDVATNRLKNMCPDTCYDAAGRVIYSGVQRFDYDALGMMNAMHIGSDGRPRLIYAYTADDERLFSFDVGTNRTQWMLRGLDNRVLRDLEQHGAEWSVIRDYVYRDGMLLAALKPAGTVEHYSLDHLGTPRLVTDGNGRKIGVHAYWPFGEEWSPGDGQEGSFLKFTGHERDDDPTAEAHFLDYMHARYYRPSWGRFLSPDPQLNQKQALGHPQLWNRYAFVGNNPLRLVDPDGRDGVVLEATKQTVDDIAFGLALPGLLLMQSFITGEKKPFVEGVAMIGGEALLGATLNVASTETFGFTSRQNLLAHSASHASEFGVAFAEQYGLAAQRFVATLGHEAVESYTLRSGERLMYNAATKEFAVLNREGKIITYHKANIYYWIRQINRHRQEIVQSAETMK